jgi:hypothetical protein
VHVSGLHTTLPHATRSAHRPRLAPLREIAENPVTSSPETPGGRGRKQRELEQEKREEEEQLAQEAERERAAREEKQQEDDETNAHYKAFVGKRAQTALCKEVASLSRRLRKRQSKRARSAWRARVERSSRQQVVLGAAAKRDQSAVVETRQLQQEWVHLEMDAMALNRAQERRAMGELRWVGQDTLSPALLLSHSHAHFCTHPPQIASQRRYGT